MELQQLIRDFALAVRQHRAGVFVGAGMSSDAGYPDWNGLIEEIRHAADVPADVRSAPLAAEYAVLELGREAFERRLLDRLNLVHETDSANVRALVALPVHEYWTTNYDSVLEHAMAPHTITRITRDAQFADGEVPGARKRLTKMHGSLSQPEFGKPDWETPPVITRSDYEKYEQDHPLVWAQLRAQFLTTSYLFLGFSFDDPNVEVLLRLSRSLPQGLQRQGHYALMRRPTDPDQHREFELRVQDLERSGIHVAEIDTYAAIENVLTEIRRRAKAPNVFLCGSDISETTATALEDIGAAFEQLPREVAVSSLAGPAALALSSGFHRATVAVGTYDPERIRFYFRRTDDGRPAPTHPKRIGACYYMHMDTQPMREQVVDRCTAVIACGGGDRTRQEIEFALKLGLPVVPITIGGGAAAEIFHTRTRAELNVELVDDALWQQLSTEDPIVLAATVREILWTSL
jgi:hypothetical protein